MSGFCRDCLAECGGAEARCTACGSPRLLRHAELDRLAIAHVDCDAFYAAVEKRDNPALKDVPVIVGGGRRGVVTTACYVARLYGVRSAMPMFKALRACPQAVVIRPRMAVYAAVSKDIRVLMRELTPLVQPVSLDEAYLDLSGTERLLRASPARSLARLAQRIEGQVGITVSIGLSYNRFLAKLASELDKPRGFAVVGRAGVTDFLAPRPVATILGVGRAMQERLAAAGIATIGDLQRQDPARLAARFGAMGIRLAKLALGEDDRSVDPDADAKSISAETTFETDLADLAALERVLWPLCEKVSDRLKAQVLAGRTVTLKLKTAGFKIRTRAESLAEPTQLAEVIYRAARGLLAREADGAAFRLIGVGLSHLSVPGPAEAGDLLDRSPARIAAVEGAIDKVRARFGKAAIGKGRGLVAVSSPPAASPAGADRPSGHRSRNPAPDRR